MGKQEWGKHDDYIQILEYIPYEPTDSSISSYGHEWIVGKRTGYVVCRTLLNLMSSTNVAKTNDS